MIFAGQIGSDLARSIYISSRRGFLYYVVMLGSFITGELSEQFPASVRLVGVKIRDRGEVKKFGAGDTVLGLGDRVMLEVGGELTYGVVYTEPYSMPFVPPMRVLTTVLRRATQEDAAAIDRHEKLAAEGMAICREQAALLGLSMKLVEVYCSITRRQMTFVYTADERIDFRGLVRALGRRFGGRIEMRQIGVRDEASRLGGIDTCGLTLCCASFLTDVRPVSVKQARGLGLPVDDPKLLGICGRLKCCLLFEVMQTQGQTDTRLITPSRSS
jgi:cell fate regulator YaaT (PSP1 superfamily)